MRDRAFNSFAALGVIMAASGTASFLNDDYDGRRFFPIREKKTPKPYMYKGKRKNFSKTFNSKKAAKQARKKNR